MSLKPIAANEQDADEIPTELKVGDVFTSYSKTLNDTHFTLFSAVTNDVHPIHYDVEYARSTQFGKPVAHGLLLNSLTALGATNGVGSIQGFVIIEQSSRFLTPVVVGDTLQSRLEVERLWRDGSRCFCRMKTQLRNQRDELVLEGYHIYRILGMATPT